MAKRVMEKEKPNFNNIQSVLDLGKIISYERARQGLTMHDVAGYANISIRTLQKIEKGAEGIRFESAIKIIKKLGLELGVTNEES